MLYNKFIIVVLVIINNNNDNIIYNMIIIIIDFSATGQVLIYKHLKLNFNF